MAATKSSLTSLQTEQVAPAAAPGHVTDPRQGSSVPQATSATADSAHASQAASPTDPRSVKDPRRRSSRSAADLEIKNDLQARTTSPTMDPRVQAASLNASSPAGLEQAAPSHHPQVGLDPRQRALRPIGHLPVMADSLAMQEDSADDPRLRPVAPSISLEPSIASEPGQAASLVDPRTTERGLAAELQQAARSSLPQPDSPTGRAAKRQPGGAAERPGDPRKRHCADVEGTVDEHGARHHRGRSPSDRERRRSASPGRRLHQPSKRPRRCLHCSITVV